MPICSHLFLWGVANAITQKLVFSPMWVSRGTQRIPNKEGLDLVSNDWRGVLRCFDLDELSMFW